MADEKIIVIDTIEDLMSDEGDVIGKLVTDKAGENHKIKGGQGGKLKKKWDTLVAGRAYKLTMGEFKPADSKKSFPFVADFEEVKNILEKEAAEKVSKQMTDNRDRSMATSYAKDVLCAGKIEKHELLDWIEFFYRSNTGQIGGTDEGVIRILRQMIPDEVAVAYKEAKTELTKPAKIPTEGKIIPKSEPQDLLEMLNAKRWREPTLKGFFVHQNWDIDTSGIDKVEDLVALLTDEQRSMVLKALK